MRNIEIANLFNEIADFLEVKGENPFRIRAYRRAAQAVEGLSEDIAAIAERGGLLESPGSAKTSRAKIQEYLATGKIEYLEGLRKEIPAGVIELMGIHGVGPKTARLLYEQVGVDSVEKLEELAKAHKLAGLPGIKSQDRGEHPEGDRRLAERARAHAPWNGPHPGRGDPGEAPGPSRGGPDRGCGKSPPDEGDGEGH